MRPDIRIIFLDRRPSDKIPIPSDPTAGQEHLILRPVCPGSGVSRHFRPGLLIFSGHHFYCEHRKKTCRFRRQFDFSIADTDHHTVSAEAFPCKLAVRDLRPEPYGRQPDPGIFVFTETASDLIRCFAVSLDHTADRFRLVHTVRHDQLVVMALFYVEHDCGIYDQKYDGNRYRSFQSLNWIPHNAVILFLISVLLCCHCNNIGRRLNPAALSLFSLTSAELPVSRGAVRNAAARRARLRSNL